MSLWLDDKELTTLTGYRQRGMRYKALAELGVPFRRRPTDGFPLVERAQFDAGKTTKRKEPNWSALQ